MEEEPCIKRSLGESDASRRPPPSLAPGPHFTDDAQEAKGLEENKSTGWASTVAMWLSLTLSARPFLFFYTASCIINICLLSKAKFWSKTIWEKKMYI